MAYIQDRTLDFLEDPNSQLRRSGSLAENVSQSVPNEQVIQAVMGILKKYQSGYRQQQFAGQEEQANRVLRGTPQDLIGASPQIQEGVRNAAQRAVQPTITGAGQAEQTVSGHLGEIKDILTGYQTQTKEAQRSAQEQIKFLIDKGGSNAIEALLKTEPDTKILKTSGYDATTLGLILPGIKLKEQQEAANKAKESQVVSPADAETRRQEVLNLAKSLRSGNAVGKSGAVGFGLQKFVPLGQSLGLQPGRASFEAKVNTLKANLTLDNLKLLKGAMSDKDLLFLNSIASSLDTNMSEREFNKELDRIIQKVGGVTPPGTNQSDKVRMTGPKGTFNVPLNQVNIFKKNGYKQL